MVMAMVMGMDMAMGMDMRMEKHILTTILVIKQIPDLKISGTLKES